VPHALCNATLSDRADIDALISRSARALGAGDYTPEQIERAYTSPIWYTPKQ